jgi:hypothetical protein
MKIIDNRKDYYDFLVGKFGQDSLIVLDRREYDNFSYKSDAFTIYFMDFL